MEQNLTALKGEIDKYMITAGNFSSPLSIIDRRSIQESNMAMGTHRTFHQNEPYETNQVSVLFFKETKLYKMCFLIIVKYKLEQHHNFFFENINNR